MIRVLVAEDSPSIRELLIYILSTDPELKVVGTAENGKEAVDAVMRLKPDIVTMDIHMPKMDGFETTRRIMETTPTPIVIVSGVGRIKEAAYTFKLLEAGALTVVLRPPAFDNPGNKAAVDDLIQTVKLMSEVKVVRRGISSESRDRKAEISKTPEAASGIQLIAIGASAGGPQALQKLLSRFPQNLSVPVLIVQHIAAGFLEGLVDWLAGPIRLPLRIAARGEKLLPGHCYIAPDNFHMGVGPDLRIVLSSNEP